MPQKCTRMPEGLETGKSIVIEAAQISAGRPAVAPPQARLRSRVFAALDR